MNTEEVIMFLASKIETSTLKEGKMLGFAIDCVEKHKPKKPIVWGDKGSFQFPAELDDWGYRCPCCGNEDIDYPEHHCPCGQALDWSEIE